MGKKSKITSVFHKRSNKKFSKTNMVSLKKPKSIKNPVNKQNNPPHENGILFSQDAITRQLSQLRDADDDLEERYERQKAKETKNTKIKLPIKTDAGIVPVYEEINDETENQFDDIIDQNLEDESSEDEDSSKTDVPAVMTATQLFSTQNKLLETKKIEVGSLSASILENPIEKINNFRILFNFLNENESGQLFTVQKLIIVSLVEVFKDLLPSYQIKQTLDKSVKLKKETLKLEKYETSLLQYYKKFLQILERSALTLTKKKKLTVVERKLGQLSINALCDLLVTHPYFNFAENIAQTVIPFLNYSESEIRQKVNIACKNIFKEDKKGEITLILLRLVNQHIKKLGTNVNADMLEILLHLNIKDVNMDQEHEQKLKQKKLMSHKSNVLQLSKSERKRKARLKELEKSLLEAKAEESKQHKHKNDTEITKLAFGIFFRILKTSTNTKVVGICLKGIAKYAHCINVEFYIDLINILDNLLKEEWLDYVEQQHCIQTIFTILNEQEILNLDPIRFYVNVYENLLTVHASTNFSDFPVVLETLICCLLKRYKKVTFKRMASFLKRITTLSLQLPHNGTLACLGLTKSMLQLNKAFDVLLDVESSPGDGPYLPELKDPEYCNASSSSLFELALLRRHYHPTVVKYSKYVGQGAPLATESNLSAEFGRTHATQLFSDFDMSEMCFNPPIPVSKNVNRKAKLKQHVFSDMEFKRKCLRATKNVSQRTDF